MIYTLKELLQKDTTLSVVSHINEQISKLLGYTLKKNKIYELSCTTRFFVDIDEKLNVLGIIVISCKSFLFDEKIFFIESFASRDENKLVEQPLLLKCISYLGNISKNNKLVSFITDERIQKEVLELFGFVHSQGIMVKI
tara:strand:- start:158 stop:577 length:420 start_codon:yes stop_codon:yes gene_type:complete